MHLLLLLLAGGAALPLATCASRGGYPRDKVEASEQPSRPGAEIEVSSTTSERVHPPGESKGGSQPSLKPFGAGPLAAFWNALHSLEQGEREEPVRVLWLGDSHTAADFMTGAIRRELEEHYGPGGPGFVRLGVSHYRHGRARLEVNGTWRRLPQQPSRRSPVLDGVFGLCGMRSVPQAGASAAVRLQASGLSANAPVLWTLHYRLPEASALRVDFRGTRVRLDGEGWEAAAAPFASKPESAEGSPLQRVTLRGSASDVLRIEHAAGEPELFGLYAESAAPKVVLDTCGIDGARIATVLAWDEDAWQAELRARRPDLVVLAFGTNETFDGGPVERYEAEYQAVMQRVRRAHPSSSCWIVGPPDAWDASGKAARRVVEITEVQRRAAEKLGCGFVSARDLMGGDGSFSAWRQASPALARPDGIHLSLAGYEKLGTELAQQLVPPASRPARMPPRAQGVPASGEATMQP